MGTTLTKAQLVNVIHRRVGVTKKEAARLVNALFDTMRGTLISGDKLKVAGFGNFELRDKGARPGRNPRTREETTIEARRVVSFKPSRRLRTILNPDR